MKTTPAKKNFFRRVIHSVVQLFQSESYRNYLRLKKFIA
jgi:hypothetical protein